MARRAARLLAVAALAAVVGSGCTAEKRAVGPSPPGSAPTSVADIRQKHYETNRYEQAEGGRMFRWFGCDQCHQDGSAGFLNLADTAWRQGGGTAQIYRSIAHGAPGLPAYEGRITPQQRWQIAGYLHGLNQVKPGQRRRAAAAQQGEPSWTQWAGALR